MIYTSRTCSFVDSTPMFTVRASDLVLGLVDLEKQSTGLCRTQKGRLSTSGRFQIGIGIFNRPIEERQKPISQLLGVSKLRLAFSTIQSKIVWKPISQLLDVSKLE